MAQSTRTTPRSSARFGRTSASPPTGRFGRPAASPQAGRFARQSASSRSRQMPRRSTSRTPSPLGRVTGRKPKHQKGIAGTIAGMLPTGAASKAKPRSKTGKAGGFAALAAAAGVAFRNRDKLTEMLNRRRGSDDAQTTPATGSADHPVHTPPPTPAA